MKTLFIPALLILGALSAWAEHDAKDLYLDKCAACHGPDGAGKTAKGRKLKMKDARDISATMTAAEMVKIVENGKGVDMAGYGKQLTGEQIHALVEYYRAFAKK